MANPFHRHKFKVSPPEERQRHGITFDSKLERNYYDQLCERVESREVVCFLRQVPFHLPGTTGYRVDCAIPWSAFAQAPAPLSVLGLDVGIRCHDAEGKEVLELNWTGRRHAKRKVPAFGKVVTV